MLKHAWPVNRSPNATHYTHLFCPWPVRSWRIGLVTSISTLSAANKTFGVSRLSWEQNLQSCARMYRASNSKRGCKLRQYQALCRTAASDTDRGPQDSDRRLRCFRRVLPKQGGANSTAISVRLIFCILLPACAERHAHALALPSTLLKAKHKQHKLC